MSMARNARHCGLTCPGGTGPGTSATGNQIGRHRNCLPNRPAAASDRCCKRTEIAEGVDPWIISPPCAPLSRAANWQLFAGGGAETGVKVSTVSRYVTALEADLSAALINRSTRRLHLTEVGHTFYERCDADYRRCRGEARLARRSRSTRIPKDCCGSTFREPSAGSISSRIKTISWPIPGYPGGGDADGRDVDLIASGADLAVRIGALANSRWSPGDSPPTTGLGREPGISRSQTARLPARDWEGHQCLVFALNRTTPGTSALQSPTRRTIQIVNGSLRANDPETLRDAALSGLGIASLPTWLR